MTDVPTRIETGGPLPDNISGYVSYRSQGGKSVFSAKTLPKGTSAYRAKTK